MERRFEADLKDLKSRILTMGGYVEKSIERATHALTARDMSLFDDVHKLERKINESHIDVDNACVRVLARLSPLAADLRLIVAMIKINSDLERMGDQAVNISYNAEHYLSDLSVDIDVEFPQMAASVQTMVRKALDAFMRSDTVLAQEVLESDDEVDAYKNRVFERLIPYMKAKPERIEACLDLILIARNLERMGDHATNIAEDVIFACTGEDVRHGIGHI